MPSSNMNNQVPQQTTQVYTNVPDDEVEIDVGEIFGVIVHYLWLIILVALTCGILAYAYSKFLIPEEFQSTTKIYVLDKSSSDSKQSTYTDLQVGSQLTKDYAEIIKSRTVLEAVIEENNLQDIYKYATFAGKVSVSTPTDTRVVAITVTDHDPALAQKMANDVRIAASQLIIDTMQIDAVNTLEVANFPEVKSSPSCSKWALIGAMIGGLLVAVIVVVRFLLDDTIKTSDDIDRYLALSTLALIPLDENIGGETTKSRKKAKKKKDTGKHRESNNITAAKDMKSQPQAAEKNAGNFNRPQNAKPQEAGNVPGKLQPQTAEKLAGKPQSKMAEKTPDKPQAAEKISGRQQPQVTDSSQSGTPEKNIGKPAEKAAEKTMPAGKMQSAVSSGAIDKQTADNSKVKSAGETPAATAAAEPVSGRKPSFNKTEEKPAAQKPADKKTDKPQDNHEGTAHESKSAQPPVKKAAKSFGLFGSAAKDKAGNAPAKAAWTVDKDEEQVLDDVFLIDVDEFDNKKEK